MSTMQSIPILNQDELITLHKYLLQFLTRSKNKKPYQIKITSILMTDSVVVKCRYSTPEDQDYSPIHEQTIQIHRDEFKNIDYDLTCAIYLSQLHQVVKKVRSTLRKQMRGNFNERKQSLQEV
jgi:hypothetical protein